MLIGPSDMRWCDRDDCTVTCSQSGGSPLCPCNAWGNLFVWVNYGYCAKCLPAFAPPTGDAE